MSLLAIDFDSTAWPFLDALGPRSPRLTSGEIVVYDNCPTWDTIGDLFLRADGTLDLETMLNAFEVSHCPEDLNRVGLFDGFADAMNALRADGEEPVVLTDISEVAADDVRAYLAGQGLDWLEVVRCSGKVKGQWCLDNGAVLLVDDAPHTILDAAAKGISVLSFPWLYSVDAIAASGATSVSPAGDWQAMLAAICFTLALDARVAA